MRKITWLTLIVLLFNTIAVGAVSAAEEQGETGEAWTSVLDGFVEVDPETKDTLKLNGELFRFASLNYPGGISDTPFAQEDAIRTLAEMGGKVTRSYVLPVKRYDDSNVSSAYVLGPDEDGVMQFNEENFKKLDRLLALANQYGVRVIIPFVDQWQWTGGIESYAAFRGYPISGDAANDPDAWNFYTDPAIKADFKQVISYTMNRVNSYTGVVYKEDPAILAWETGNELGGYNQDKFPQAWTTEMAAYIQSEHPEQLVLDGRFAIHPDSLADPNIDVVGNHFYTGNFIDKINADRASATGKKPYILGEFGLYTKAAPVDALFNTALQNGTSGVMIWSLRPHKDDGGFLWHDEDPGNWSSYHWPGFSSGDWYDETNIIRTVYKYAHYMNIDDREKDSDVPAISVPANAPVLFDIDSVANMKWKGSVGAAGYEIQRSRDGNDWVTVEESFSDGGRAGTPAFHDELAITGEHYYYRVRGVNESGASDWSNIVETTATHIVTDELSLLYNDNEKRKVYAYDHSANLVTNADVWNEQGVGFKASVTGAEFGYLTYGSPVPIHRLAVKTLGGGVPQFMISATNGGFAEAPEESVSVADDADGKVYTLTDLPADTRFVKLLVPGNSSLRVDRVELEYLYDGEGYVALEPITRGGFIVDSEFTDLPDAMSANMAVADGALTVEDAEAGFVQYRTGGDINSYRVMSKSAAAGAAPLTFEASLDGVHFTEVQSAVQSIVNEDDSVTTIYSDFAVKTGTRYLKVGFPAGAVDDGLTVTRVEIGYGKHMIPLTDKPPVNVLEDGEYYFGNDEKLKEAYTADDGGDAIEASIESVVKNGGSYGMKVDYGFDANYYAGLTKELGGADLSGFDALQAWVTPDDSGNKLRFRFKLGDHSVWEAEKALSGTEGRTIQIKYDEFEQPSWDTPVAGMDMGDVQSFSIYVSSDAAASANSGTIYLDDIRVASATKLDNYESYGGYDTLVQKAYSRNSGGGKFDVSLTGEHKSEGAYGLKLDYDVAAAGYAGATLNPNYLNLSGYDGFSMWFKPDDSYNKLVIQFTTEDGKFWETSTTIKGTDARLMYVPFAKFRHPSWYGGDANAVPDASKNIIAFSIYINKDEGKTKATSGTVYIDDINGALFNEKLANASVTINDAQEGEGQEAEVVAAFPYTVSGTGPAGEYVTIRVGQQQFNALINEEGAWSYDIPRMVNGEGREIRAAIELYDETAIVSDTIMVNVNVPGNTYQEIENGGGTDPVDTTNYSLNGSFDEVVDAAAWPLLPKHWTHKDAEGNDITNGIVKLEGNARTGDYKLVHYNGSPYEAISSQKVTGLAEGIYELTAWTRSKDGNPQLAEMTAAASGEAAVSEPIEAGEGTWVKQTITGIAVTDGELAIAFRSKSTAGDFWISVDDVSLTKIGNINYAVNGGFESFTVDASSGAMLPDSWVSMNEAGDVVTDGTTKMEASASSHSGSYQLAHWKDVAYKITTSQEVTGLKDGTYELRAWTRSKGGQAKAEMRASGYGGAMLSDAIEQGESTWVQQRISGIQVKNGKLTISFYSDSVAGSWIVADDVELIRTGNLTGGGPGDGEGEESGGGNSGGGTAPEETGKPKAYSQADIAAAIEDGVLSLAANAFGIQVPAGAAEWIGDADLAVAGAGAELVIPAEVLKQLAALVKDEQGNAFITIKMLKADADRIAKLLASASANHAAELIAAGEFYDFELSVTNAAGEVKQLSAFAAPITVKLKASSNVADGFIGLYYVSGDGRIVYAGNGKEGTSLSADVNHFSTYGIIRYNKNFTDVPSSHWASAAVQELAAKQVIEGVSATSFAPNATVTRAQFAAMLVRALGWEATGTSTFADVAGDSWYSAAVATAVRGGIVNGRSATTFAPNEMITREEMTVMLVRAYSKRSGTPALAAAEPAAFKDAAAISGWAKAAVDAAFELKLLQGDGKGSFLPRGNATRAESAQVIYKLLQQ